MMKQNQKTSLRIKLVSLFLAVLMVFTCIPSGLRAAADSAAANNPLVLTNASVDFRDNRFQTIDTVESGALFYLMITVAGNNVNQQEGVADTYRVYLTDDNMLLPSFAGNGLVDGATYNKYTLHIEKDADGTITSRYIEFTIENGSTEAIRLQAKFANGITPTGTSEVLLVQESSNKSVSNSIDVTSSASWSASKSEDKKQISSADVANGTTVNYTLHAAANNANKDKGAWWVTGLQFSDTISLSGMTFTDAAQASIQTAVENAVANSGYALEEGTSVTVTVNGNTAQIDFALQSNNTAAEMGQVNLSVPLTLNPQTVTTPTTGTDGIVTNSLSVSGKCYGEDTYDYTIGGNDVALKVTAPKGAVFTVGKSVQDAKSFYLEGDTVAFTISATNTGDTAGDITLTDAVPAGLTLVDITSTDGTASTAEKNVVFTNVPAGATVTATVACTVDAVAADNTTLTNTVSGSNGKSASSSILARTSVTDYTIEKTGAVTYNGTSGDTYSKGISGQKAHYTITVKNEGTLAISDLAVSDTIPAEILNPTLDAVVAGVSLTGNALTGSISLAVGETVSISVTGDVDTTATGTISNTATAGSETSQTVTFTPEEPAAKLWISKTGPSVYRAGETITYTIQVGNTGTAAATGVAIADAVPTGVTFNGYTMTSDLSGSANNTNGELTGDLTLSALTLAAGETVTITITGTVDSAATDAIDNHASYTYHGSSTDSNTVTTTRDTSGDYQAEKWIVDAEGNTLVDANGNVASDFAGFALGDTVVYRMAFYNNGTSTLNGLQVSDWSMFTHPEKTDDIIQLKVVETEKSSFTAGQDVSQAATGYSTAGLSNSHWYIDFPNDNLESGGYVVFEYTTRILLPSENSAVNDPNATSYDGWRYTSYSYNEVNFGGNNNGAYSGNQYGTATVPIPWDHSFATQKSVSESETNITDSTLDDLKNKTYDYTITFTPDNADTTDYSGKTFVITDELPDGMTYVDGSIAVTNATLVGTSTVAGNQLTIQLTSNVLLSGWNTNAITITYQAKLTADKAEELWNTTEKSTLFTNTVTNVTVKDGTTTIKEKTPNATATVNMKKVTPAPGFAKLAAASFPGKEYDASLLNKVEQGYITAGDTLIWHAVVYNGDGSAAYTTENTAVLKNYSITDTLPSSYTYAGTDTYFYARAYRCTLDSDGSYPLDANGLVDGVELSNMPTPTISGQTVTWDFSGDAYQLQPNQCLVLQFATTAKQDLEGVITNTGYATLQQGFTVSDVVAGEKNDSSIENSANYNIVGLTTESWKTITYTSQNHDTTNGDAHTDPDTDTGESRTPTHNYVQGMQGEAVTYHLCIQNNSPLPLENMTIIDRLPFVGDKGLVSGYDRNSAFSVAMGGVSSVKIGSDTLTEGTDYRIMYSTDKTSTLDEFSNDWRGQNDVMNWTTDATNAVNFRIEILNKDIPVDAVVDVEFIGIVPSYVENTGEGNIAWNSFAYAYQNASILADTVMVAEPAKVGVWVETPDTSIDVTINKTLTTAEEKAETFYFALFDSEDYGSRLSDIVSVTIPAGQTTGTVMMQDVDLASIKLANNANNVYLLETDAKGNAIQAYTADYNGTNVIPTDATADATVEVANTSNTGTITVTKTLISEKGTKDTFYFALFTKNADGEYIRYEDAGIKTLTLTGTASGTEDTLTFSDVPKNVVYYVLETNANGVLENADDITKYTSQTGKTYEVTSTGAVTVTDSGANCTITNTEQVQYSITVNKSMVSDRIETTPVFYVGLFTDPDDTTANVIKPVLAGDTTTFTGLSAGTYYVYECDASGVKKADGSTFTQQVYLTNADRMTGSGTDVDFTVRYDDCGDTAIVLTDDMPEKTVTVRNADGEQNKITVIKTVAKDGYPVGDVGFRFALFTYDAESDTYVAVAGQSIQTLTTDWDGTGTTTFAGLDTNVTYFVFEVDGDGNPVQDGETISTKTGWTTDEVNGPQIDVNDTFVVSYPSGSQVKLVAGIPQVIYVVNTANTDVSLNFAKLDVSGNPFLGAEMSITKEGETIPTETWTTDGTVKSITGLAEGKYVLTEKALDNYVPVSVSFEVGADGYLKTDTDTDMNCHITADSLTVYNRSTIRVDKTDMGGKELEGALIQITRTDGSLTPDLLTLQRGETELTKAGALNAEDLTLYTVGTNQVAFYSDGLHPTELVGLPDGEYTMTEVTAPNGYDSVTTDLTFTIQNGKVITTYTGEEYSVDENKVTMKDRNMLTISKTAIGGTDELAGAEMKLTYTGSGSLQNVLTAGGEADSVQKNATELTWTSGTDAMQLSGLPDGSYTLEEIVAPDGYTVITTFTFEITDGKLAATGNAEVSVDDTAQKLTVMDATSSISISKMDISGQTELSGATLTLTGAVDWTNVKAGTAEVVKDETDDTKQIGIRWTSADSAMVIENLPDGEYTLEESGGDLDGVVTLDGKDYLVIPSKMTFTVENGVIVSTSNAETTHDGDAEEGYYYYGGDGKTIEVCDAEKPAETTTTATTTTTETTTSESTTTTTQTTTTQTTTTTETSNETSTTAATTTTASSAASTDTTGETTTTAATTTTTSGSASSTGSTNTTAATTTTTSGSASSAGPTNTTGETTTTAATTTTTSGSVSSAGPTNTTGETTTTAATITTTSGSASSAGPTNTTGETTTTAATTTAPHSVTVDNTELTPAATTTAEQTSSSVVTSAAIETTVATSASEAETTTTTAAITTEAPETTQAPIVTTTVEEGVVIRKCDIVGNEIEGASLTVEDLDGNVLDAWISEAGQSHVFLNAQVGVPYRLTEVLAPADFAIAEPIYFQLEADGTVSILTYELDEAGTVVRDETGTPVLLNTALGTDRTVTMVDAYIGTGTVTASETTTVETTTETTTTTQPVTEDNGEQTPTTTGTTAGEAVTTVTAETQTGTDTAQSTGTTTAAKTTTATKNGSSSSSSNKTNAASSPKTDDILPAILIPAGVALAALVFTGCKRKK